MSAPTDAHPAGSEFTFFDDPQVDRVAALVWQLAQELHVTRRRVLVLEQLLVDAGTLDAGAVDAYGPAGEVAQRLDADGQAAVMRLMRSITDADDRRAPMREQFAERFESGRGDV